MDGAFIFFVAVRCLIAAGDYFLPVILNREKHFLLLLLKAFVHRIFFVKMLNCFDITCYRKGKKRKTDANKSVIAIIITPT